MIGWTDEWQTEDFPFLNDACVGHRTRTAIVFVIGGATYEEAKIVAQFNAAYRGQAGQHPFIYILLFIFI